MNSIKIAPSILAADFMRMGDEVREVVECGADLIHVDVMDGHFTPNITMGPGMVSALRGVSTVPLDVHLMITDPAEYVDDFAHAGADIISFHIEASRHPLRIIHRIKELGCQAGIVLNPATSHDEIEYIIEDVDMVLVMTVNPGFGGQEFISEMLPKIKFIRDMLGDRDLEVDGGIDAITAPQAVDAGANVLVAGSYIYKADSYLEAIETLKHAAGV